MATGCRYHLLAAATLSWLLNNFRTVHSPMADLRVYSFNLPKSYGGRFHLYHLVVETVLAGQMSAANDYKINADRCGELAKAATNEADRKTWLGMERYWLSRLSQRLSNDDPPLIKPLV